MAIRDFLGMNILLRSVAIGSTVQKMSAISKSNGGREG